MADQDETLHPYELLDSAMMVNRRRHVFGDKIMLTEERADELEPFGSIRPWGEDDTDLVDDERELPGIIASAKGREDLAAKRMAKRNKGPRKPRGEESETREGGAPDQSRVAPSPAESATERQVNQSQGREPGQTREGREKAAGRRG